MKWVKAVLVPCLLIPAVISCKSRSSETNLMDTNIREVNQPVRVIYRDDNTVFLVTCPLENGAMNNGANNGVNDHLDDEKFLGRESCNERTAAKDASGKPQFQKMPFTEYESKLKRALGFQKVKNQSEIEDLKAKIERQKKKLDSLITSQQRPDADSDRIESQLKKTTETLNLLQAQLGPEGEAETKISLLSTLISYLDANSKAAFNIAESEAGQLLAPFLQADGNCSQPNRLGMVFCQIPPGTFMMGSPTDEEGHAKNESPQHEVTFTDWRCDFNSDNRCQHMEMMDTEITQDMWISIMGENPSYRKAGGNYPVDLINWFDINNNFLPKLNETLKEEGYTYRLPTEAEWEYAARGKKEGPFGVDGELSQFAHCTGRDDQLPKPVGKLKANIYGLFDMHGNVEEWVQDGMAQYTDEAVTDPLSVGDGIHHVIRGGCYAFAGRYCRSASRKSLNDPNYRPLGVGFRLVRTRSDPPQ